MAVARDDYCGEQMCMWGDIDSSWICRYQYSVFISRVEVESKGRVDAQ